MRFLYILILFVPTCVFSQVGTDSSCFSRLDDFFGFSEITTCLSITTSGDYLVAGRTFNPNASDSTQLAQLTLMKYDSEGNFQSRKLYSVNPNQFFLGSRNGLVSTRDSAFLLTGSILYPNGESDAWIMKVSEEGEQIWFRIFGGVGFDVAKNSIELETGEIIVVGGAYVDSANKVDVSIWKLDPAGNIKWQNIFGFPGTEWATGLASTDDGGFLLTGTTNSYLSTGSSFFYSKVDSLGNEIWTKRSFFIANGGSDILEGIESLSDGDFLLFGSKNMVPNFPGSRPYLLKINDGGEIKWEATIKGKESINNLIGGIDTDNSGNITVVGAHGGPLENFPQFIASFSSTGDSLWLRAYVADSIGRSYLNGLAKSPRKRGFFALGYHHNHQVPYVDTWLLKTDNSGRIQPCFPVKPPDTLKVDSFFLSQNFPNPFSWITKVEVFVPEKFTRDVIFRIFDKTGRLVFTQKVLPGKSAILLNAGEFRSGIFIYELISDDFVSIRKKMVVY